MPVKTKGRVFTNPESIVDPDRLIDKAGQAMDTVVSFGAQRMRELIEARGTGKTWSGDWSRFRNSTPGRTGSSPGRVASGQMRDDVSDNVEVRGRSVAGAFGWLEGTQTYYLSQELGFTHNITGGHVEAMHALRDAATDTDEFFEEEMFNAVREYLAGK